MSERRSGDKPPAYNPPPAPVVEMVRLADVIVDDAIQPRRKGIDKAHAEEMAAWLRANPAADLPPVRVFRDPDTGKLRLSSGFHRVYAYKAAEYTWIPAEVRAGDRRAAKIDARDGSNNAHGLKFSNEDKEAAVNDMLDEEPEWTDERVAGFCGVTQPFVGKVKSDRAAKAAAQGEFKTVINSPAPKTSDRGRKGEGRPNTKEAEAAKVGKLLKADPSKTDAAIAAAAKCKEPLVKRLRKRLEKDGLIPHVDFPKPTPPASAEPDRASGRSGFEFGANAPAGEPAAADAEPEPPADPGAAFVAEVEAVCRDLDRLAARVRALKESPLSYCVHVAGAADQVAAARKTLWVGRPAHECPYCRANGEVAANCGACKGTGRVKADTYKRGVDAVGGAA